MASWLRRATSPATGTGTRLRWFEYALFEAEIGTAKPRTVFYMTSPYEPFDWIDLDGTVAAHRHLEVELGAETAPVRLAMACARAREAARPPAVTGPAPETETATGAACRGLASRDVQSGRATPAPHRQ